jgi:hypothetical protein
MPSSSSSSSSHEESPESSELEEGTEVVEFKGRMWLTLPEPIRDTFAIEETACSFDFWKLALLILPIQDGHVFVIVTSETVFAEFSVVESSVGVDSMDDEASLQPLVLVLPAVRGTELASDDCDFMIEPALATATELKSKKLGFLRVVAAACSVGVSNRSLGFELGVPFCSMESPMGGVTATTGALSRRLKRRFIASTVVPLVFLGLLYALGALITQTWTGPKVASFKSLNHDTCQKPPSLAYGVRHNQATPSLNR